MANKQPNKQPTKQPRNQPNKQTTYYSSIIYIYIWMTLKDPLWLKEETATWILRPGEFLWQFVYLFEGQQSNPPPTSSFCCCTSHQIISHRMYGPRTAGLMSLQDGGSWGQKSNADFIQLGVSGSIFWSPKWATKNFPALFFFVCVCVFKCVDWTIGGYIQKGNPDAPWMYYLSALGEKWPHSRANVGNYSLHGAFG